ncbi:MAG: hypothetical protein J6Z03_00610 [Erysipelotrichaceae bacterium]|nr:hypothetical protein [Erysipelotrichaceae bacterium]
MNIFVEGLQGSGKTTLSEKLTELYPEHHLIKEGDYSPVELAWCAYTDEKIFQEILKKYPELSSEIKENTFAEGDHRIICYTKIRTDNRNFYQDLEQYEIYNKRTTDEEFQDIILSRYQKFSADQMIFECSLLQNITEEMILFRDMSDKDILSFYEKVRMALSGKDFTIFYLITDDIKGNYEKVRKERVDDKGNEVWHELMMNYFNDSPYAINRNIKGEEALIGHLKHRQQLEIRICEEIYRERCRFLRSKKYTENDLYIHA